MALLKIAFAQFQNAHGPYLSNQSQVGSRVLTLLFGPYMFTAMNNCTTICPLPQMSLLLMSSMGISFLVINSARSMSGVVQCMSLIQK